MKFVSSVYDPGGGLQEDQTLLLGSMARRYFPSMPMGGGGRGEGSWVKGEQSPRSNMEDDLQLLEGTLEPWVLGWGGVRYGCWHYSCQTGPARFTPPPGLQGLV